MSLDTSSESDIAKDGGKTDAGDHFIWMGLALLPLISSIRFIRRTFSEAIHRPTYHFPKVFREYYPTNERAVFLEYVWETDKYRLLERISEPEHKSQDMHNEEEISRPSSTIQYQSIETLLGDDESEKGVPNKTSEENHGNINPEPSKDQVDNCMLVEDGLQERGSLTAEDSVRTSSSPQSNPPKFQSEVKSKLAFIQVRKPAASTNEKGLQIKPTENNNSGDKDVFFNLLTNGIVKNSFL